MPVGQNLRNDHDGHRDLKKTSLYSLPLKQQKGGSGLLTETGDAPEDLNVFRCSSRARRSEGLVGGLATPTWTSGLLTSSADSRPTQGPGVLSGTALKCYNSAYTSSSSRPPHLPLPPASTLIAAPSLLTATLPCPAATATDTGTMLLMRVRLIHAVSGSGLGTSWHLYCPSDLNSGMSYQGAQHPCLCTLHLVAGPGYSYSYTSKMISAACLLPPPEGRRPVVRTAGS